MLLVVAVVITALAVTAVIFAAAPFRTTVTISATTMTSSNSTTSSGMSSLYQLEFVQESYCPYGSWLYPWGVMLNGETLTQPSNATVPPSVTAMHITSDSNLSIISFSVPNGTYSYTILPKSSLGQSSNVTIDGSNVEVQVYAFITAADCSSSTTT
jgi:hypothetical protein